MRQFGGRKIVRCSVDSGRYQEEEAQYELERARFDFVRKLEV